jgi:hypothetical protein
MPQELCTALARCICSGSKFPTSLWVTHMSEGGLYFEHSADFFGLFVSIARLHES